MNATRSRSPRRAGKRRRPLEEIQNPNPTPKEDGGAKRACLTRAVPSSTTKKHRAVSAAATKLFEYRPVDPGWMRVLRISGRGARNQLVCTLKAVSAKTAIQYTAISHARTDEKPSVLIECNRCDMLITPSLHEALEVPCQDVGGAIWIYGICVNQEDDVEKSRHIQIIDKIFTRASLVIIWLGPAGLHTEEAVDHIEEVVAGVDSTEEDVMRNVRVLRSRGLSDWSDAVWHGFGEIFTRSWFRCLWTAQEVALAQLPFLYCGTRTMDWRELCMVAEGIHNAGLEDLTMRDLDTALDPTTGIENMMQRQLLREELQNRQFDPLSYTLRMTDTQEVSEPVDRVYAVWGLIRPTQRASIPVDYSADGRRDFWKVYMSAAHVTLQQPSELVNTLSEASRRKRLEQLPSWCPNYNSSPKAQRLPWFFLNAGKSTAQRGNVQRRIAIKGRNYSPHVATARDGRCITLEGFAVDIVAGTASGKWTWSEEISKQVGLDGDAAQCFKWLNECTDLARTTLGRSSGLPEALIGTLAGGELDPLENSAMMLGILYIAAKITVPFMQASMRNAHRSWWRSMPEFERDMVQKFIKLLTTNCTGRQFFSTGKHRLGLGPLDVQQGDIVCVFRNVEVPYILRPVPDSARFRLVGEAYVHGIMQGEIFNHADEQQLHERYFEIE